MKLTPMRAIRAKCMDCCCGQFTEVRLCTAVKCPLYAYRMGHRPKDVQTDGETFEGEKSEDSPMIIETEEGTDEYVE